MADDPFWETEFMILEFDPRTAGVSVHNSESEGVQYSGYGRRNREEAVRDATAAATSRAVRTCSGRALKSSSTVAMDWLPLGLQGVHDKGCGR